MMRAALLVVTMVVVVAQARDLLDMPSRAQFLAERGVPGKRSVVRQLKSLALHK